MARARSAVACWILTESSAKSFALIMSLKSLEYVSLPTARLISASHAEAALTYTASLPRMAARVAGPSLGEPSSHHRRTCVSSSKATIVSFVSLVCAALSVPQARSLNPDLRRKMPRVYREATDRQSRRRSRSGLSGDQAPAAPSISWQAASDAPLAHQHWR